MAYEGLVAGEYKARPQDWGVKETVIDGKKILLAVITFAFNYKVGTVEKSASIRWEGFFFKKDGDLSSKTLDVLDVCGFKSPTLDDFTKTDALNTQRAVNITLEFDGKYWRVEWVNDPDETAVGKVEYVKSVQGYEGLGKINAALSSRRNEKMAKANGSKPPVKNHAPGAGTSANDEEIPF